MLFALAIYVPPLHIDGMQLDCEGILQLHVQKPLIWWTEKSAWVQPLTWTFYKKIHARCNPTYWFSSKKNVVGHERKSLISRSLSKHTHNLLKGKHNTVWIEHRKSKNELRVWWAVYLMLEAFISDIKYLWHLVESRYSISEVTCRWGNLAKVATKSSI